MRIFATGTTGTIGRHLRNSITSVDFRRDDSFMGDQLPEIKDRATMVHLAGVVGPSQVAKDPSLAEYVNVAKTRRLIEECARNSVERFIYVSSSHVYGSTQGVISENSRPNPISLYAEMKYRAEQSVLDFAQGTEIKVSILRVFSVLGWESSNYTLGGRARRIAQGAKESLQNSDDLRDFLTPRQIAGLIFELALEDTLPVLLNLGSGKGMTVSDAVSSLFRSRNFDITGSVFQPGQSDNPEIVADPRLLSEVLKRTPPVFDPLTSEI